jgi:hypothetical protein
MEPATILVLVLCTGVGALLVWFEINSRRNEANKEKAARAARSSSEPSNKNAVNQAGSKVEKNKAA